MQLPVSLLLAPRPRVPAPPCRGRSLPRFSHARLPFTPFLPPWDPGSVGVSLGHFNLTSSSWSLSLQCGLGVCFPFFPSHPFWFIGLFFRPGFGLCLLIPRKDPQGRWWALAHCRAGTRSPVHRLLGTCTSKGVWRVGIRGHGNLGTEGLP